MKERTIDIHIDEMEYTRDGLRTPADKPLPVKVGYRNLIRFVRPERVPLAEPGVGGFAFNSSFPTPGVLQILMIPIFDSLLHPPLGGDPPILQVFGHTDASGKEAENKVVSERRARSVHALLSGDVQAFKDLAKAESWGIAETQVMLRVLQCDCGPPDGVVGPLTRDAIEEFQHQYNAGIFHRHIDIQPSTTLKATGEPDDASMEALLEAFVVALSPNIPPERFHPTHPVVGCSEFNRFSTSNDFRNRRTALALHRSLPEHHDKAPCALGDHTVCPVDNDSETRCMWYREHFVERLEGDVAHRHFDLRWKFLDNRRVLLSALTTLENDATVEFRVFRSRVVGDVEEITPQSLSEDLSDTMIGQVKSGVAFVVWEHGEHDVDFLAPRSWQVPIALGAAGRADLSSTLTGARVPVFTVSGGNQLAVSPPPTFDASRAVFHPIGERHPSGPLRFYDVFGSVWQTSFSDSAAAVDDPALRSNMRAVAMRPKLHVAVGEDAQ